MTGLVAVVATGDAAAVTVDELERLVADYERLRGTGAVRTTQGNDRVRAVLFGTDGQIGLEVPVPPSWRLCAGRLHVDGGRGVPAVEEADGQFATVAYDADADRAVVTNDPLGMHSVFVAHRPGRTYVATSAMVLAKHVGSPVDRLGLQGFLVSGYSFGTRTAWEGVRRLDPGTRLSVGAGPLQERPYWRPEVDHDLARLPLQEAVAHSIDVGRATCAARLADGAYWADLTGGFDSRLMCLLLDAAGVAFETNTRAAMTPDDVDIAGELASLKGWPWFDASLPETWPLDLPSVVPTALAWGDAQLEVLQLARVLDVHRRLAERRPTLLSAGGGEHFQYYAWQPEFLAAGRSSRVHLDRWVDMIALKPVDDSVLAPGSRAAVRDDYRTRLAGWLRPYRDELNTTQLELLYAYKSTGHFGAYRSADGAHLRAELPFYFKPIFSAAISMHHGHRNRHLLMRHMIERLDPQAAAVRTTRGGPATPWTPAIAHRFLPYYRILGRKAVTKLTGVGLGRPLLLPRSQFAWEPAANGAVLSSPHGQVLDDPAGLRIAPLLASGRLETLVSDALRVDGTSSTMLGRVLTAELALRATDTSIAD